MFVFNSNEPNKVADLVIEMVNNSFSESKESFGRG